MNQYLGTAPSTFQVLYRDLFFFAVCTLFQLALDIILGPRFATMHVTPGFAIIFQKSLKEKVKENNYWLQCLFAQNTKTPTPPHLEENIFRNGCKPNTQVHPVRRTFAKAVRASALSTKASTAPPSSVPQKRWSFSLQWGGPYCWWKKSCTSWYG